MRRSFSLLPSWIAVSGALLLAACGPTSTPTPFISALSDPGQLQGPPFPQGPVACPNVVTLQDTNPNADIYYTTDGSVPTVSPVHGVPYNPATRGSAPGAGNPFQVNGPGMVTVTAVAQASSLRQSPLATWTFNCPTAPPPPTFTPLPAANQTCPVAVAVNATAGASLVISNDGNPPSLSDNAFFGPPPTSVTVPSGGTLEAIACLGNPSLNICSPPTIATYSCNAPTSPSPGATLTQATVTFDNDASGKDASENYWIYLFSDNLSGPDNNYGFTTGSLATFAEDTSNTGYSQHTPVTDSLNIGSVTFSNFSSGGGGLRIDVHGNFGGLHNNSDWRTNVSLRLTFQDTNTWTYTIKLGGIDLNASTSNNSVAYPFNFSWSGAKLN